VDLSDQVDGHDYLEGLETSKYSGAVFKDKPEQEVIEKEQFEFFPGTGDFIDMDEAAKSRSVVSDKGEITFNFEGDELAGVVNFVLGEILKENYVIAPGVQGKVTFATVKPINKNQVLPILEMLLSWNNAALVHIEDRYHVMPKAQAIKGNLLPQYGHIENRNGYTVMVIPLKYIAPTEMEKVLAPYIKDGAVVKADNARNLIFLSGTKRELSMYLDTINIFDVDWLEGMSTGIFSLNRVEATTIVAELEAIFGEGADNPLAGMFRFMPLERLNAIMVITPQENYLYKAKEWILRLDRADSESALNLYVYDVKNIKADDLAGYLSDVFGGGGGSSKPSNAGQVVPGATGQEIGTTTTKSKSIKKSAGSKDSDISITAIEENNQILINASAQEYESIMAAISRLDKEPLQVLIEAKIIEVSLNEETKFGVQWLFGDAKSGDDSTTSSISTKRFAGIRNTDSATLGGGDANGNTLSYLLTGVDVSAAISALDASGKTTVLSTPSILVLNNKEASINVGDEIPVVTNSFSGIGDGNGGNIGRNSVSFRQTGITLDVKPRINPGGLVYLELTQEVSVPGDVEAVSQNRSISNRKIKTEIAIQSGQTVVMGGLIDENRQNSKSGVPILSKVPGLGNLFGKKSNKVDRTELLVLITPTVIENPEQAKQLTKEYANQFKGLKPLKTNKEKYEKYYNYTGNKENNQNDDNE
jgi:general secretion pathway protein D